MHATVATGNGFDVPKAKMNGSVISDTVCRKCGGMMVRTGTCLTCLSAVIHRGVRNIYNKDPPEGGAMVMEWERGLIKQSLQIHI